MDYNFDIKKGPIYVKFLKAASSTSLITVSTDTSKNAAIRSRFSGKATSRVKKKGLTYKMLHEEVCKFANVLKANGIKKGDRVVSLYADGS